MSSTTPDPNPGNNTAQDDTDVITSADLWIDKQGVRRSGNPSQVVEYTLVVHNDAGCETDAQPSVTPTCGSGGPSDAQQVVITDQLPFDPKKFVVQYVSPQCTYTKATHSLSCTIGTLPAGVQVSFVVEAQVAGSVGLITNAARIASSATPDPVATNNQNTVTVLMKGAPARTSHCGEWAKRTLASMMRCSMTTGTCLGRRGLGTGPVALDGGTS